VTALRSFWIVDHPHIVGGFDVFLLIRLVDRLLRELFSAAVLALVHVVAREDGLPELATRWHTSVEVACACRVINMLAINMLAINMLADNKYVSTFCNFRFCNQKLIFIIFFCNNLYFILVK
jgi:hypothetical protein